jgi:hypothetical protein
LPGGSAGGGGGTVGGPTRGGPGGVSGSDNSAGSGAPSSGVAGRVRASSAGSSAMPWVLAAARMSAWRCSGMALRRFQPCTVVTGTVSFAAIGRMPPKASITRSVGVSGPSLGSARASSASGAAGSPALSGDSG